MSFLHARPAHNVPFNVVTARFNLILGTSYNHDFQRELIKTKPFSRPVGCFSWAFLYIVVVVSPCFCFETKPQKKKKIKAALVRRKQETSKFALTRGIFLVC